MAGVAPRALWASSPSTARAVELVSAPWNEVGSPVQGLRATSLDQPPFGHCWASSQAVACAVCGLTRHPDRGQRGQRQSLPVRAVKGGIWAPNSPLGCSVATSRLTRSVPPKARAVCAQRMGVEDEQGELAGSVGPRDGDVLVDMGFEIVEGGGRLVQIDARRRPGPGRCWP